MALLAAVALLPTGTMPARAATSEAVVGQPAPDYLGKDRHGNEIRASDFRGKVVVVTFWASWCGYCLKELPILANVQALAGVAQLQVVAINDMEPRRIFVAIARRSAKSDIILTHDADGAVGKPYGVDGIPHMVMIGRDGTIAYIHVGYGEDMLPRIANELNRLLAMKPPPEGNAGVSRSDGSTGSRPAPAPAPAAGWPASG
ncbi:MAG TPA: TlpA disulfide reductase family protein [Rhodanobacteraceae bacterium]|nr:TlpA disulfide reductase family protein [Rhodanobacteraceae bacterium]